MSQVNDQSSISHIQSFEIRESDLWMHFFFLLTINNSCFEKNGSQMNLIPIKNKMSDTFYRIALHRIESNDQFFLFLSLVYTITGDDLLSLFIEIHFVPVTLSLIFSKVYWLISTVLTSIQTVYVRMYERGRYIFKKDTSSI